jgi:hypothetical protein
LKIEDLRVPRVQPSDYCREIEAYLCRKNDGHLIRVVGPSFQIVSRWAAEGIPLKVAFGGIDRYFERYYRHGPRRRPVKIDFCEADVRDVFDDWRRAVGLVTPPATVETDTPVVGQKRSAVSLPAHLERVVLRLTNARVMGTMPRTVDDLLDDLARELDRARSSAHGVRGHARQALLERLGEIDRRLLEAVREGLTPEERVALELQAQEELASFRETMSPDLYSRALSAAADRLMRERFALPTVLFEGGSLR